MIDPGIVNKELSALSVYTVDRLCNYADGHGIDRDELLSLYAHSLTVLVDTGTFKTLKTDSEYE